MNAEVIMVNISMSSINDRPTCTFYRYPRINDTSFTLTQASKNRIKYLETSGQLIYSQTIIKMHRLTIIYNPYM